MGKELVQLLMEVQPLMEVRLLMRRSLTAARIPVALSMHRPQVMARHQVMRARRSTRLQALMLAQKLRQALSRRCVWRWVQTASERPPQAPKPCLMRKGGCACVFGAPG